MNTESDEPQPKKRNLKGCYGCVFMLILFLVGFQALGFLGYNNSQNLYTMWCGKHFSKISMALELYAKDHNGYYPPLSNQQGQLMMHSGDMVPHYLDNAYAFTCTIFDRGLVDIKGAPLVDDHCYYYLSHVLTTEKEGLAYVEAYKAAALKGKGFDQNFIIKDGTVIPRINTANVTALEASKIPVMIEKLGHHSKQKTNIITGALPPGKRQGWGHVLYLDGHVEFIQIATEFPMTTEFIEALKSIDQQTPSAVQ